MKKITLLLFLFTYFNSISQTYWQQEVNYDIQVKLDDKKHLLSAFEIFEYVNNSPDTLSFIYIHLWPNAYKNEKTALGKQLWSKGNEILKFIDSNSKGRISGLDFTIEGVKAQVELSDENPDICRLILEEKLLPKAKIKVSTPFIVNIPSGSISRLGHIGQSYQITQWYPKPAVYDKNGWNPIPYLNQGEFYSEYGTFDVMITLPKNYVVAATGDLQTESELEFLNQKNKATKGKYIAQKFPEKDNVLSDSIFKTIRYTQSKVHDFAWFADKSYEVLKGEVILPHSKKVVNTWAMFTPENSAVWKNSIEYINDGTYYYSLWNGDYPYNNVTAVDGTISAGGGMEYPNVTVIGNASSERDLEIVIVHEVGHNWFYGILGSNERVHGWMDEGLNTFNEMRYIQTKYPNSDKLFNDRFHFDDLTHKDNGDISYRIIALLGEDQPIETSSSDFSSINYGIIMYQKTGLILFYLKAYLGDDIFDQCMHQYFERWKFKHPQPKDLRDVFEDVSNKKLDWFFNDLIKTTNHIDYKIKHVKHKGDSLFVKVKNKGQVDGPFDLSFYSNDSLITQKWIEPGSKISYVKIKDSLNIDYVILDKKDNIPEINRSNNQWNKDWLFNKFEPLKFELILGDNDRNNTSNFWSPLVAGNTYDHMMVGLMFHNYTIPSNRFQYLVTPLFSFPRKNISGIGELSYAFLPKKKIKLLRLGASVKSFKNEDNFYFNGESSYANISPYIFMKLGDRNNNSNIDHSIHVQSIYNTIYSSSTRLEEIGGYIKFKSRYRTSDVKGDFQIRNDLMTSLTNSGRLGRISVEARYRYRYFKNEKDRWVDLRFYLGNNYTYQDENISSNRYQLSLSGINGNQDIFYEDYYFARTSSNGNYSGQQTTGMGDFKTNSSMFSSSWVATFNTYFQLPVKPNIIGVFADVGFLPVNNTIESAFNTGIGIKIGEFFGLYLPLYNTMNMGDLYNDYTNYIRFSLKLNVVNFGFRLPDLY